MYPATGAGYESFKPMQIINVVFPAMGTPEEIEGKITCPSRLGPFTKVVFSSQSDKQLLKQIKLPELLLCLFLSFLSLLQVQSFKPF